MHLLTQKGKFQILSKELLPTHRTPYPHTQREEEREREREREGREEGRERRGEREKGIESTVRRSPRKRGFLGGSVVKNLPAILGTRLDP